jgi:NADH dehydrogenase [ubiquinone] 1 alpha subcomplex assembly factor 1
MKPSPIISLFLAGGLLSLGFLAAEPDVEEPAKMKQLMDFESKTEAPKWFSVNDGVMGGMSKGLADIKHGSLHFRGDLSLENNGGFSSIRTAGNYDFSGKKALVMRVKGDGRTYQLRLATDARYRDSAVSYGAEFATESGKWIEVKIPFGSLSPSWRGNKLDGPAFDAAEVEEIGILIGDKKDGQFSLEVDWIGVE